jgi:diguanylate cyclase (GGDEF)-like protein/PAS domain S-box-containing protein
MKNRLSVQIALAVSLLAFCGAAIVSVLYYFQSYSSEIIHAQQTLLELGQTVESTASIAAYLSDRELANEVIAGLKKNEMVAAVQLTSTTGLTVPAGFIATKSTDFVVRIKLNSPFIPDQLVGELLLTMKQEMIDSRARESAWRNAAILGGYTLFIALLVFLLIQWRFIFDIKQIAFRLDHIVPGTQERLGDIKRHRQDELGGLINNINKLLSLVQEKLDSERALLKQMETLEKRFRMIYERAGVGIFLMDQRARLVMANSTFIDIVGVAAYERVVHQNVNCMLELFSEPDKITYLLDETIVQGHISDIDLKMSSENKQAGWVHCLLTQLRDDSAAPEDDQGFIQGIMTDISERKAREQAILFQAERDPLTHLFNRRSAEHNLRLILEKSIHEGESVAICLIDLDNFKPINDIYGHDSGDTVLVEVSKRMTGIMRKTDVISRWGGDEFLLLVQDVNSRLDIETLLDKLLAVMTQDIEISQGVYVRIGASIGVVMSPEFGSRATYRDG